MSRVIRYLAFSALLSSLSGASALLTACVSEDDDPGDAELDDLAGQDEKSDGFASMVELSEQVLDYGASSGDFAYSPHPRYHGFRFRGTAGDSVEATVHAPGDVTPLMWILDEHFHIVSQGQEVRVAEGGGHDGHVRLSIPSGTDRPYYVFVRTQGLVDATLRVDLAGTLPSPGCDEDNPIQREIQGRDRAMPRAVLSYMRAHGWGCMHREWHDVRQLDFLVGLENVYIADHHPEWVRVDPQEGAPGNGLDFLAMHRVMLATLRAELPGWDTSDEYADLRGFAWGALPTDPDDAAWPVPAGNPRVFGARAAQALANFEQQLGTFSSEGQVVDTDDRFGLYLQTRHRPVPGTAWNLSTDLTTGFHNYVHGRFNDPQSPVRMGNFARNIEGRVFWRLHGWIDEAWSRFRLVAHAGVADADDPVYMDAMNRACADMMRAHAAPGMTGESMWSASEARCIPEGHHH